MAPGRSRSSTRTGCSTTSTPSPRRTRRSTRRSRSSRRRWWRSSTKPELIKVQCDAHSWMLGWIYVTEAPAAVTDGNGAFKIENVPAGNKVEVTHPVLGKQTKEVEVKAGQETKVAFELKKWDPRRWVRAAGAHRDAGSESRARRGRDPSDRKGRADCDDELVPREHRHVWPAARRPLLPDLRDHRRRIPARDGAAGRLPGEVPGAAGPAGGLQPREHDPRDGVDDRARSDPDRAHLPLDSGWSKIKSRIPESDLHPRHRQAVQLGGHLPGTGREVRHADDQTLDNEVHVRPASRSSTSGRGT